MRQYSVAVLTISGLLAFGYLLAFDNGPVQAQTNPSGIPTETSPKPSSDVYFINRAKNLARQATITANGGLDKYRPNAVMYGPAVQTSYVNNSNGSITFTFTGGVPGVPTPSIETVATVMPDGVVNLDYNGPVRNLSAGGGVPPVNPLPSNPVVVSSNPQSTQPITAPIKPSEPIKIGLPRLSSASPILKTFPSSSTLTPAPLPNNLPNNNLPNNNLPSNSGGASLAATTADQDAFLSKARNIARQTAIKENGGLDRYRPEASMFGPSGKSPYVKNADGSVTFTFKGGSPGTTVMTVESVVTVGIAGSPTVQYNGPVR